MNLSPPSIPEKSNKKVSRACNTCRLKRKKCDGLDPCFYCAENKLECSYSREPRRRGPPSGYLRHIETRVVLLETLLGVYIAENADRASDPFLNAAERLLAESKTCSQEVWDNHKSSWAALMSAKIVDELAMSFSPFHRADSENFLKPLLPTAAHNAKSNASLPPSAKPASPSSSPPAWSNPLPQLESSPYPRASLEFYPQPSHILSRESFERTQDSPTLFSSSSTEQTTRTSPDASIGLPSWPPTLPHEGFSGVIFGLPRESRMSTPVQTPRPATSTEQIEFDPRNIQISTNNDTSTSIDIGPNSENLLADSNRETDAYAGSYWRTADFAMLDLSPSPKVGFDTSSATKEVELPPPHILYNLIDIYYQYVYPSFPLLPPRVSLDSKLQAASSPVHADGLNTMLLALCAYSGRLSYNTNESTFWGSGDAGKLVADLWYEQSRTAVTANIRRGSSIETVQALLLLALRDHGRGYESQAWLLVGLAVRMGQDLDLNEKYAISKLNIPSDDRQTRQNVWGVSLMLDLFLSLQLGRPPAIVDTLRMSSSSQSTAWKQGIFTSSVVPGVSKSLFAYTILLYQIISRVNLHFYLGFGSSEARSRSEEFSKLKAELDAWLHTLPHEYRISIGHQPDREVLEVNMLYHVAIILLYRPFSKNESIKQAADVFFEAASTFNVLLEKYRQSQILTPPGSHSSRSSLSLSNPNIIYLIFTVSIAHLSSFKLRQVQQESRYQYSALSRSTTITLQTQLHLLNCLEALNSIGCTWELARRCCRTLDRLMDIEGMKPKPILPNTTRLGTTSEASLGKRKREIDDQEKRSSGMDEQHVSSHLSTSAYNIPHFYSGGQDNPLNTGNASTSGSSHDDQSSHQPSVGWLPNMTDNPAPMLMSMDSSDPGILSSMKWLPEGLEADSIGLGMVWDGEWDDSLWSQGSTLN